MDVILASSFAALTARLCSHPLDTITCRLQIQQDQTSFGSMWRLFKGMILHEGGFRSLYKGFGPVLIAAVPASILFMVSYEASQQFLKEGDWKLGQFFRQHALITHGFSALSAELVSALLWVPQDVLRLR